MPNKLRTVASAAALLYGQIFVGIFLLLSMLSLFGTDRPFFFFSLFFIMGIAFFLVAYGLSKGYKYAAAAGICASILAMALLIRLYSFSTGNPVNAFAVITRSLVCAPLVVLIILSEQKT